MFARHTARFAHAFVALSFAASSTAAAQAAKPAGEYHVARQEVIGGDGGWDYLTVDTVGHRLFVMRSNRLTAVDLATGKILGELPGLNRGHGVAFDYKNGRGFATSGADSTVVIFDLNTLKELGRTTAAVDADAVLYDPASNRVFTFNGDAGSATAIDPVTGKRTKNIDLGGKPEYGVTDGHGRLYVNIADKSEVVELDPRAMTVTRRWSIKPCEDPSGLAIDRAHERLFSVCGNKTMVISDAAHGRVVATVPIGAGVDAAAFDPATGDAFASNGEGTITVVHEDSPSAFRVVQTIPTITGARTIALDPTTHRVYTLGAKFGPQPAAATKENPRRRAPMIPGSATIVVLER
jgi:DNA-binding beta-propeller fold protein YncE